jgi:hypothetical protein
MITFRVGSAIARSLRRPSGVTFASHDILRRYKSTAEDESDFEYVLNKDGDIRKQTKERVHAQEIVSFPSEQDVGQPVLLNAKEHVIGYLSRILNARVYEAAIETQLQYATNLSAVSRRNMKQHVEMIEMYSICDQGAHLSLSF